MLGLDGIVAIGGDGTFRGAQELSKCGVSVVGIPGTIDNDIVCTEYTIGFDTAANTAVECIDKLRDTMQSHERCAVVEVMGRHAGYLALYVGVAVGATAVLVPERPYDFHSQVAEKIRHARLNGKTNFMIVVAEGAASAVDVGRQIQEELALDPRVTILGHIQRGGSPTAKDRVMATRMGYEAVQILAEGKTNRVICTKDDQIIDLDIDEGLAMKKTLNRSLSLLLALVLAVSLAVPALAADEPVTLDQTKLSLSPKQSVVLHATRSSEYQDQRITWKSSDTSVATLSDQDHKKGNVTITAKKKGTTAITASVGGYLAVCNVTVEDDYVTDVTITPAGPETLPVGKTRQLEAEVVYAHGTQGGPDRHLDHRQPQGGDRHPEGLGHRSVRGHSGDCGPVQGGQQERHAGDGDLSAHRHQAGGRPLPMMSSPCPPPP